MTYVIADGGVELTRRNRCGRAGFGGGSNYRTRTTYRYKLDDGDLAAGATQTDQLSYTPGLELEDGLHTLYVQERDDAGNWSDNGSATVHIEPDSGGSQTLQISHNDDDGEIVDTMVLYHDGEFSDNQLWCGYWAGLYTWAFFRFALTESIPFGATITDATLNLWGTGTDGWENGTNRLQIVAEDTSDTVRPDQWNDWPGGGGGAVPTSATVVWGGTGHLAWSTGQWNTTPNLGSIIQELIDRYGGLSAGAHITLWLREDPATADGQHEVAIEDHGGTNPAELAIIWQ